ncbi:hypothetical protein L1987_33613 [Smallanthus sonchifolius]|uniref:Uncharacterized protein n=1 Tax=Smallanthus sonchifolius TaxID=185202 RepID=A0ACB9HU38_9ASTR|nr:hypothetical protein L1987_33613 [Smallanthus sonchifolius]
MARHRASSLQALAVFVDGEAANDILSCSSRVSPILLKSAGQDNSCTFSKTISPEAILTEVLREHCCDIRAARKAGEAKSKAEAMGDSSSR